MPASTKGITKIEGVRRALQELGPNAPAPEIQVFLRDRFGIEMKTGHIYVARGEIRYKEARQQRRAALANPTPSGKKISKLEGVRRAVAQLGNEVDPQDIQRFLLDHYGLEIGRVNVSKYLSHLRLNETGKKTSRPGVQPSVAKTSAAAKGSGKGSVSFEDLQQVKALVERLGADRVRLLIGLLG